MQCVIGFQGYEISCIIGDLPIERSTEQEIIVDLKLETDVSKCVVTDDLRDTLDYTKLTSICHDVAKNGKYRLLETLAHNILEALFNQFTITWATVVIKKPEALPGEVVAFVELTRKANL